MYNTQKNNTVSRQPNSTPPLSQNYIKLINHEILGKKIDIVNNIINKTSKNIISITTIPPRFILDEFDEIVYSFLNQIFPADYIIINICRTYKRNYEYDINYYFYKLANYLKECNKIFVNICENDYGPMTSVFGILECDIQINQDDIIIFLEDSYIVSDKLTFYYTYIYQLYQADIVTFGTIDEINTIFYDGFNGIIESKKSWSIQYKYVEELLNFYNDLIVKDDQIKNYDGLIATLFSSEKSLYFCAINLNPIDDDKKIKIDCLGRNYEYCKKYIIDNKKNNEYKIPHTINERFLLFNCKNVIYCPKKNINLPNYNDRHFIITCISDNIFCLTISILNNILCNNETFILSDHTTDKYINISSKFNKFTLFYNSINTTILQEHKKYNISIFQSKFNNILNIYEKYCLCSILAYQPDIKYIFYNDNDCIEYIEQRRDNLINSYHALIPGAYKCDLFRAIKIYYDGGIYIDFKMLLLINISTILANEQEIFCRDIDNIGIYNAFIYVLKSNNKNIRDYIKNITENIENNFYGKCWLSPTGPKLLNKYINNPVCRFITICTIKGLTHKFGYIEYKNNNIIIKNTYNVDNYYKRYKYISNSLHYGLLWTNKNIYTGNKLSNKINLDVDYFKNINFSRNENIYIIILGFKIDENIILSLRNQSYAPKDIIVINKISDLKKLNIDKKDKIFFVANPNKEYLIDTITTFEYAYQLYFPYFCWSANIDYSESDEIFLDGQNFRSDISFEMYFEYENMNKIFFENTDNLYSCKFEKNKYIFGSNKINVNNLKIDINIKNNCVMKINDKSERYIIKNIKNVEYFAEDNSSFEWFMKVNFIITYVNKNQFALTIYCTEISDCLQINVFFRIDNIKKEFKYEYDCKEINKKTYIVNTNEDLIPIEHNNFNFNVMQTAKSYEMCIEKYYSICSILSYIPDVKYVFYNNDRSIEYLNEHNKSLISYYYKLKPGAYKADLFRAIYIYITLGLYLDCKYVLLKPFSKYLLRDQFYCNDNGPGTYNAIMFNNIKNNNKFREYLNNVLTNIYYEKYGNEPLDITSCTVLGRYYPNSLSNDFILFKHRHFSNKKEFCIGHILTKDDIKVFQTNYSLDYYLNGTYVDHYNKMYCEKNVFDILIGIELINIDENNNFNVNNKIFRILENDVDISNKIICGDISEIITITIPTNNIINYLILTLDSLKIAFDNFMLDDIFKKNIILVFSCEPNNNIFEYINKINWINVIILKNKNNLGIRKNPFTALEYAFNMGSIFNLHLEDDILCSKNIFHLLYYFYKNRSNEYFMYGMFNYIDKNENYNKLYKLNIVEGFLGYGWCITDKVWKIIKEQWFINPVKIHNAWDWSLNNYMNTNRLKCLNVSYPFTKHFGEIGTYSSKEHIDKTFGHIKLYNDLLSIDKFFLEK